MKIKPLTSLSLLTIFAIITIPTAVLANSDLMTIIDSKSINDYWVTLTEESNKEETLDKSFEKQPDNNLKYILSGFPVSILHTGGSYQSGQFIDVTAKDIEGDGLGKLFVSSLASGPLNGIKSDGTQLGNFPVSGGGVAYSAAIDKFVVSAFTGKCNPSCASYVNLYSQNGDMIWSKPTLGLGVDAAPIFISNQNEPFVVYENSREVNLVSISGEPQPGWPINHTLGLPISFASADFDKDGSPEIVVALKAGNGEGLLQIRSLDGSLYGQTVKFGIQTRIYPTIGDVNNDGNLEVIVVGRTNSSPYNTRVYIFNSDAALLNSFEVNDSTLYGTQNSLADMNGDGTPEILFLTNHYAFITDANGTNFSGWPKPHVSVSAYQVSSNIVVGDLVSDGDVEFPEVAYTLRADNSQEGYILIFNHDGTTTEKWDNSQLYPIGAGGSHAISDIDGDGYNDLIIRGDYWDGQAGSFPALWAINLNYQEKTVAHGRIEWGQYGNNSEKTSLYNNK